MCLHCSDNACYHNPFDLRTVIYFRTVYILQYILTVSVCLDYTYDFLWLPRLLFHARNSSPIVASNPLPVLFIVWFLWTRCSLTQLYMETLFAAAPPMRNPDSEKPVWSHRHVIVISVFLVSCRLILLESCVCYWNGYPND